jgi:hypothetical protein
VGVALATAVALLGAGLARADGDPASDFLYGTNLFPSYDSGMSTAAQAALMDTIADAHKAGYPVKVAIIAKRDDLGSVTSLDRKPRQYARFLGIELGLVSKGPVLIVMPNGFGFYHAGHDPRPSYAVLEKIAIAPGGNGLAQAGIDAVAALAAKAGHPITPHRIDAGTSTTTLRLILAGAGALVLALVLWATVYRTRRRRAS